MTFRRCALKDKNFPLFVLIVAYSIPIVVAGMVTKNASVGWGYLPLAVNIGAYYACSWARLDSCTDDEEREAAKAILVKKRWFSSIMTLLFGLMVAVLVLVTKNASAITLTMLMCLVSWLEHIIID